jgi:succinoglycan biosynthesis transport protein ExoP
LGDVVPFSNRSSFLMELRVTHDDPEAAALVANRYVEQYYKFLGDQASGINDLAGQNLTAEVARLQKESEKAEQEAQQYVRKYNLISLDSSKDFVNDTLHRSETFRQNARLELLALEDKLRQVEAFKAEGKSLLDITQIAGNPIVSNLRGELSRLQQELSLLLETYLERNPKVITKLAQINAVQNDLDKAIENAVGDLRSRVNEARQLRNTYEAEYNKSEEASMKLRDRQIEYNFLKQQADVARGQYTSVLSRLNELKTKRYVEKIPVHPLDRATIPGNPIAPNKSDIIRTGSGLFVLIFIGVAVGLSFIDDRIKSAWDVESFIGANLLGIIPDLASMKDDEKYTMLLDNRQSPGVEAFLSVYSSIKIHSKLDFPKSILITSTIPGEGKTLISCNVAGSFARHGKKTLLIDCDLRRPMLHRHFKQQNTAGLLPWFENGAIMEGDLATNPWLGITKITENLSLLSSGGRSKSPTELLEHPLFGQLLERLKREYDLIIVDSPPLGAVTDSLLIAERIDEVVYVCRFNRAYRKHIRLYMRTLRNGKNEVLGIVLNGLSPRRIEYYSNYRYYRSYKKYYGAQT